jgi:DNA end-binding protein Ku
MPRAIWSGSLAFGLVSIPVKLFPATIQKDVRFHEFDRRSGRRVKHRRVVADEWPLVEAGPVGDIGDDAPAGPAPRADSPRAGAASDRTPRDVPYEDVLRGYEVSDSRYVMLDEKELTALRPEPTHTIAIEEFVPLGEIDPVFFDKTYLVLPQRGAEKPYALLRRAMQQADRVAVARFVLRTKEHLAAIRPYQDASVLETLFYADELVELAALPPFDANPRLPARELELAIRLIEMLGARWDASRHRDEFRQRVEELIQRKAGQEVVVEEPARESPQVSDLLAALRESVEAARAGADTTKAKRRRSAG